MRRELGTVRRLATNDPNTVYLGYETGQLALRLDPPTGGVRRVLLVAVSAPGYREESAFYYHAVVRRVTDDDGHVPQREVFRHPFPALDWLHESVPDFDLLETVPVNVPDGDRDG